MRFSDSKSFVKDDTFKTIRNFSPLNQEDRKFLHPHKSTKRDNLNILPFPLLLALV